MANLKASKQGILTNERNRKRNVHFKTLMKTTIKKAKDAISAKAKDADTILITAIKTLDKLTSKGIIHKNAAARRKSNLTTAFNKAGLTIKPSTKESEEKKAAPKKTTETTPSPTKEKAQSTPSKTASKTTGKSGSKSTNTATSKKTTAKASTKATGKADAETNA